MRRTSVRLVAAAIIAAGILVSLPDPAAALFKTWTSDTDFAGGNFLSTEVAGSGDAASIQLSLNPLYNWIQRSAPSPPSVRRGVAMTFSEATGAILAFGGVDPLGGFLNQLWSYNVTQDQWTLLSPATSPPARWKAGFSYDPGIEAAILYGGYDGFGIRTDLWRYYVRNNTWFEPVRASPAPRSLMSTPLAYHTVARVHVLASGNSISGDFETWAYNAAANTWTNRAPAGTTPNATEGHTLTYDRQTQRVVLFGGGSGLVLEGDLWEYDYGANRWTLEFPWTPNVTPNKRTDHAMVFGPHNAASILFGGIDESSSYQPETWLWVSAGKRWEQPPVSIFPRARKDHAMAWDSSLDRTIMFGGIKSDDAVTNETWMWGPGYFSSGTYDSPVYDAGCDAPLWKTIWWNVTRPPTTTIRFKLATSDSPSGPFAFVGWNGLPGTFYNGTAGQGIWGGHNQPPNQRYLRWKTALTTVSGGDTAALEDFSVAYDCFEELPYIVFTSPAHLASWVAVNADIVVRFSIPMDAATVNWTFTDPAVTFTPSWDPTFTVLTLSHTTPFQECNYQTIQIFGRDLTHGYDLVDGPVPNPWRFSARCDIPTVSETDPPDAGFNVALDAPLWVRFSEPMNTTSVRWSITGGITLTGTWNPAETELTLTHGTLFTQCTAYTTEITAGKDKIGIGLGPGPVPNPWSFATTCPNPYIGQTDPADGATNVPVATPIVVTFSAPMNTSSVTWTISPAISETAEWSAGDTVLTFNHTALLREFTVYTVEVTAGKDKGGLPLVPGAVPNPWDFRTLGDRPKILETTPADGDTGVAVTAPIVVTFSEAMDTASVTVAISPTITLTRSWNAPANTTLTLTHTAPFAECTDYTVTVGGRDPRGFLLDAGPVPNPWTFTTVCPLGAPRNLRVAMAGPDVRLVWDAVAGATGYRVFGSQDRFAAWPWVEIGTAPTPVFFAAGHGADLQTHYYIVRAVDAVQEGPNSTMGVKTTLSFGHSAVNTNVEWFSLPYVSAYRRASDVAAELGPANIDVVGKWVPGRQSALVYYYSRGAWRGTDFPINAGDGLYLGTVRQFLWNVTGTDAAVTLSFTRNAPPLGNVNWVGIPYTGVYARASDIADELGSGRITEVGLWNPVTQSVVRWYWDGSAWTGTDFTFEPGAGIYVIVAADFTWTPLLITPAV